MNMKQLIHKYKIPAAGGLAVLMFWLYGLTEEEAVPPESALVEEVPVEAVAEEVPAEEAAPVEIAIDIKGAVEMPGIYMMTSDQRVNDAINKAGGLTEKADAAALNLAQKVQDEMVVYVPAKGEDMPPAISSSAPAGSGEAPGASGGAAEGSLININTADSSGLQELPGVGEAKAQAIIDYRETEGPFAAAEDLKNVSGIGDKTFEKLEPLITLQ
jgi:competence protein ComEA